MKELACPVMVSRYFSDVELTHSAYAARHGLPNEPDEPAARSLVRLATDVLDPVRTILGPIRVLSGYRSPQVNAAVGGSPKSQHLVGEAADIIATRCSVMDVYLWMMEYAKYDQLILEFGRWVHVSYTTARPNRAQNLVALRTPEGATRYVRYTPEGA